MGLECMYEMCLLLCRLKVAKGVIINKLFIKVNASDSSYMPERVSVAGCYTNTLDGRQHTLKETTIPSYDFTVLSIANCFLLKLCRQLSFVAGKKVKYYWHIFWLHFGIASVSFWLAFFCLQLSSEQKVSVNDIYSGILFVTYTILESCS